MTVAELRAALEALPADADAWTVVLSRDSEGNAFGPCAHLEHGAYAPWHTWEGDFASARDMDEGVYPDALCLWPVR